MLDRWFPSVGRAGDQRDWVALHARLLETLRSSGHVEPDGPLSAQDADFLADKLTDVTYAMFELESRQPGVGSRAAETPRGWRSRLRKD